ncbi:hypothetical protein ACIRG5_23265 [Lentzea sp. NPDC102401]|uniref:hypothetical protein n=1 Tax=Lentzea sp. NPDC102401 TaxID=3364128 RepID=UPI003824BDBD
MLDPRDRPRLRVRELLEALREIDWVMSGSTVLAIYGVDLEPNDLDVVPSPDPANLRRVADLLLRLDAVPAHDPSWRNGLTVEQCRAWRPDPVTLEQLDHLFVTRLGMVDVPPTLTGTYAQLKEGASRMELAGLPVWVCDPREVLDRVPDPPRAKDLARAEAYAALRTRLEHDHTPLGLGRLGIVPKQDAPAGTRSYAPPR